MIDESKINNDALLDRICQVYGFSQKIQLARHFNIAASSLQNRYKRGNVSYDFAVHCSLETNANITWLMTGEGPQFIGQPANDELILLPKFTLSEGELKEDGTLTIDKRLVSKKFINAQCVSTDSKTYFLERESALSDGLWLVNIEGAISIRELTVLPAKKLHVAGGKVPFECGVDDIVMVGRVVGTYSEAN